jgi:hypothetical protein
MSMPVFCILTLTSSQFAKIKFGNWFFDTQKGSQEVQKSMGRGCAVSFRTTEAVEANLK